MLRISLDYGINGDYLCWTLNTLNHHIGMMCIYPTKPTRKQIRRQCKAVGPNGWDNLGKLYDIRTGKFK